MSKHLFGLIATPYGTAANNRGENEGNITTLQKLLWKGEIYTTVSAEAIRWAIRYFWQKSLSPADGKTSSVNRHWNEETADHEWQDSSWRPWTSLNKDDQALPTYIDDDAMGFMLAEAANTDGSDGLDTLKKEKKALDEQFKKLTKDEQKAGAGVALKNQVKEMSGKIDVLSKGTCDKRRGAVEVTRAISLTPYAGDITFNAKSGVKGNTSLYGTEMHATRYQYGFALTPESLRVNTRANDVVDAIVGLCEVAGNQSRFLYDFSPDSVVFRWTDDFAPRLLYGFDMDAEGTLSFTSMLDKVEAGDIDASELYIGGSIARNLTDEQKIILKDSKNIYPGVKAAATALKSQILIDLSKQQL